MRRIHTTTGHKRTARHGPEPQAAVALGLQPGDGHPRRSRYSRRAHSACLRSLHGRQEGRGQFSLVDALGTASGGRHGREADLATPWSARSFWLPSAPLVSVPIGILTAIFLTEYSHGSKSARMIRFCAKILSGLPSILAGVFIFGVLVATTRSFSVIAGGLGAGHSHAADHHPGDRRGALARAPFSARRLTRPGRQSHADRLAYHPPDGGSTIITGVMLAVARAAGETAPIIFTALFTSLLDQQPPRANREHGRSHL